MRAERHYFLARPILRLDEGEHDHGQIAVPDWITKVDGIVVIEAVERIADRRTSIGVLLTFRPSVAIVVTERVFLLRHDFEDIRNHLACNGVRND